MPPHALTDLAKSDDLPALWEMLGPALRQIAGFGVALRLRVVVDTSTILAELRWLLIKRKKPGARTALTEAISAAVVVACAPPRVDQEVRDNLDELAQATGAPKETIWALWLDYRRQLSIVEPRPVVDAATSYLQGRDPSDIAFVQLSQSVGASALLTEDQDLLSADKRAVRAREIVIDLRNYARHKTIELTIIGIGTFSFNVGIRGLVAALRVLPRVLQAIARLPVWLHLILLGVSIWLLASEERRQAAKRILARLRDWLAPYLKTLVGEVERVLEAAVEAHHSAEAARTNVLTKVPAKKVLLRQAVYAACATAVRPLSVSEIERAARANGYTSAAKSLRAAILRTLRADGHFREVGTGWTLQGQGVAA